MFYLLYIYADLPIILDAAIVTYANDTAILVARNNPIEASLCLRESLFYIQRWLKKLANQSG